VRRPAMGAIGDRGTAALGDPGGDLRPNLRAYLASTGATGALTAGALTVFLGLAALVGFDDLLLGGGGDSTGTVLLDSGNSSGAPEAAAAGLAAAPGAVASTPVASGGGAAGAGAGGPGGVPGTAGPGGGQNSPGTPAPGTTPPGAPPATPPGGGGPGVLGGTVGAVEDTAGGLGLDLPLSDLTGPITDPVDRALNDVLNQLGPSPGQ
jgi:hypothetical protein